MAKKKEIPSLSWWTKLAANIITWNKPGIAITIADIPKFLKEVEVDETEYALRPAFAVNRYTPLQTTENTTG